MAKNILRVGPSPHLRAGAGTVQSHYMAVVALVPALLVAMVQHGPRAFLVLLLAVVTGVLVEALTQHIFKQPIYALDGHAILMGVLFTLLMPPSVPLYMVVLGMALAVVVAKQIFGGLGCYAFHPVLIGYLMLLLSWPRMLAPIGGETIGTGSEWSVYAVTAGGLFLLVFRWINWRIPLAFFVGVMASGGIFHVIYPETVGTCLEQLMTGHAVLALFFLSTDNTTSPANKLAQVLYGLIIGVLITVIRVYGIWMEVAPFAVLLGNLLSPLLDRIQPKPIAMEKNYA